ncbi:MAG TPA: hypothetical protein VN494_07605 [Patescibacteria group bacterium]|nr:hypothetical protein [Patescibacteria group bacterium]
MTTAIDSNVLIALWNEDDSLNTLARSALDAALGRGSLVIAAPVFAELLAAPLERKRFSMHFAGTRGSRWTRFSLKPSGARRAALSSSI